MKMAKATEQDMQVALRVLKIIEGAELGIHPGRSGEDDPEPETFNEDDPEHIRAFYDETMGCFRERASSFGRVVWGMDTIMHSDILDPDVDHLALHPRYNSDELLNAAREALAAIHDIKKAFGAPGDYGYDHPQGKSLVRLYMSTQALAKTISEKEPKKDDKQKEPKHE